MSEVVNVAELFGKNVFNETVMRERLPKSVFKKLKKTIEETMKVGFSNIVIVNNGSSDGTEDWLSTLTEANIIVVNLPTNTGGAGGFKAGSSYICTKLNTDWVFFYDDDAYPETEILKKFSEFEHLDYKVYTALVRDLKGIPCSMNLPFTKVPKSLIETLQYIKKSADFVPDTN